MPTLGYTLASEEHGPRDLVAYAQEAERIGFSHALISDHFHPWIDRQGQSPFVWGVIGAVAQATQRLTLGTGVTCPTRRIHPAIIAQAAATGALTHGDAAAREMCQAFARRRDVAAEALSAIPGVVVPRAQGAFYLFPDFSAYFGSTLDGETISGSVSLSELLLEKAHVAAVGGKAFGADGHLRFSYALAEEGIREGIGRVREVLARATPQPKG